MRNLILTAAAVLTLNACGNSIDTAEWTEEVKLHDGQTVIVWRKAQRKSSGFPDAKRGAYVSFELRFDPMNVQWQGPGNRSPLSFEIFEGVPYLALYIRDRESCRNKPATDYLAQFFRWSNGQWIEVKQADFPVEKARMNLYQRYWGHTTDDDAKSLITWEEKASRDGFYRREPDTVKTHFERGQRFCAFYQRDLSPRRPS